MKKQLALLLALAMMLSLLTACGGSAPAASQPETAASEQEVSAPESEEAAPAEGGAPVEESAAPEEASASEEAPEEPAAEYVDVELPLVDEETTMSMWMALKPFLMAYNVSTDDMTFYKEMEKRTGVHMDITSVAIFAASESFNLLIASGDYPDLMDSFQVFYTGSADSAIEQEIIVDLMDYMDEYMPNYRAALDSDKVFWMDSLTQEGALPSANMLFSNTEGATIGLMMREDWLKKVNMDVPVTYDDMEAVLAAFKEEFGVAALGLGGYGQAWGISAGMGVRDLEVDDVSKAAFLNVDGEVSYSPANEGYREYLEMLSDWYQKGYVWQDFISQYNNAHSYMISGEIGIACQDRDNVDYITSVLQAEDPDAGIIGIKALRKDPDEILNISYFVEKIIYGTSISATSENKELAARWLDYCYSPEGQILTNYGVEGEGLQYDADGNPCYTDLVLFNDEYSTVAATTIYSAYGGAMLCDADRVNPSRSDRMIEALANWGYDTQDWVYPTKATMTNEQGEEYTTIINEANSYIAETTLKFIIGDLPINDDTWGEYLETLDNMGLQRAIEIKQEALDSYLGNA